MDATFMLSSAPGAALAAASASVCPGLSSDGGAQPGGPGFPALLDEATGHQDAAASAAPSSEGAVVEGATFVDWWMMFPLRAQAAAPVVPDDGVGDGGPDDATEAAPNGEVEAGAALGAEGVVPAMVAAVDAARTPAAIVASVWSPPAGHGAPPGTPAGLEPGTKAIPTPGTMPGGDVLPQAAALPSTSPAGADASIAPAEATAKPVEVDLPANVRDSAPVAAGPRRLGTSADAAADPRRVPADTAPAGNPASRDQGSVDEPLASVVAGTFDRSSPDGSGDRQSAGSSPERRQDLPSAGEPARSGPTVAIHGSAFVRGLETAAPLSAAGMPAATDVPAAASSGPSQETLHHLVQAMRMQFKNGIGEAVVRLNPEHLGAVSIALRVERGAVSATVIADAPNVRRWLEAQEPALRQGLAAQGLHLDRLAIEPDERHAQQRRQEPPEPRRRAPKHDPETFAAVFDVVV